MRDIPGTFQSGDFMKKIFFIVFFLTGCFGHWEEPSSKLASQANNYLDNERNTFFYRYCSVSGDALNCLIEWNSLHECQEELSKAGNFQRSNYQNARRFISPDIGDWMRVRQGEKKPTSEREAIEKFKEGFQYTIDAFTEHEFPQCSEIAYGS